MLSQHKGLNMTLRDWLVANVQHSNRWLRSKPRTLCLVFSSSSSLSAAASPLLSFSQGSFLPLLSSIILSVCLSFTISLTHSFQVMLIISGYASHAFRFIWSFKCIWSNWHPTCLFTCYYLEFYLLIWVLHYIQFVWLY